MKYAKLLYEVMEKHYPKVWKQQKNVSNLSLLYPTTDHTEKLKEYTIEKLHLCLLTGVVCVLLGGLMWIKEANTSEIVHIERNAYGEGSVQKELTVTRGEEEVSVSIEVEERAYTKEELEALYETFTNKLMQTVLSQNMDFDHISRDLTLPANIEGYPFSIEWITQEELISLEGVLLQEEVEEPIPTVLEAHISGDGLQRIEEIPCLIYSREEPFSFSYKIKALVSSLEESSREESKLTLPSEFEGVRLSWKRKEDGFGKLLLFFAPMLMAVLYYCKDQDLAKQVQQRQEQMKQDYPTVVGKLALYLGAGMTIGAAWEKVAQHPPKSKEQHFVYQEMLITLREIESGMPTNLAYENFGKRCHENCYTKFVAILLQNRTRGSNNVTQLLKEEAAGAFEIRKQTAKMQGEKAGTKMLGPMMLLLLVVLIIVMVPAFMNQIF